MYVKIGPYRSWFGPYQLAEKILFWKDGNSDEAYALGDWLDKHTPITKICQWYDSKFKKRKVKIRIDKYDTWGMDHTLALIALPMLKQLRVTKHGSPGVRDEDVPEELRSTNAPGVEEWDTDDNWHKRWDWVMDEMIWAFEQIVDDNNDSQFFDHSVTPIKYDADGHRAHNQRIVRGTTLFGKYYQGLWD